MGTISEEWHWEREGEGVEARGACLKERERERERGRGGNTHFIEVSKYSQSFFPANANLDGIVKF